MDTSDVCVLIPTLNEAETVGEVIDGFTQQDYTNILVVDGGSTDGTREVAREHGAKVIEQTGSGKGQAVQEALGVIEDPYIVIIDGDGTYLPSEVSKLLEPLERGYDHVIGNRLGNKEAFSRLNYFGNRLFNKIFRLAHGRDLTDLLTGYRAFRRAAVDRLRLEATGFGIETEMTVEALKHDQKMLSVPISYMPRTGSSTKLNPFRDGARIAITIYRMTKTNNPFFYFGSAGALLSILGFITGVYVVWEQYINGITHELLAVLTALLVIVGIQLFIFASLSDVVLELHRDQMREIRIMSEDRGLEGEDE